MKNMSEKFQQYSAYMQEVTPKLLEAEKTVSEIKNSPEWKRAFNYFQVLYTRGILKERPTSKNGYKIETGGSMVQISDIESILTPEQLEIVKQKAL